MKRTEPSLSILFVDDDESLLAGLSTRLRDRAPRWDMTFAASGAQAIEVFERRPFDLLITDARMPSMNGAQLLRTVAERWPATMRVVLSGYADQELGTQFMPVAHQYLRKPCQPVQLDAVVERCLRLQELLPQPQQRALVGRVRQLPVLAEAFTKLQRLLARNDATLREAAQLVVGDPVLAARVLQLANSSFLRRKPRQVTSVEQAVAQIGFGSLRNLVLGSEMFAVWNAKPAIAQLDLQILHEEARRAAAQAGSEDAALAALLRNIGYWVLMQEAAEGLERAGQKAVAEGISMHEAELSIFGAPQAAFGAYLLGLWGLPDSVIEVMGRQKA